MILDSLFTGRLAYCPPCESAHPVGLNRMNKENMMWDGCNIRIPHTLLAGTDNRI